MPGFQRICSNTKTGAQSSANAQVGEQTVTIPCDNDIIKAFIDCYSADMQALILLQWELDMKDELEETWWNGISADEEHKRRPAELKCVRVPSTQI